MPRLKQEDMKYIRLAGITSAAAMILLTGIHVTSCTTQEQTNNDKAKYIFLFIGDGMGASQVAAVESYLSYKEGKLGGEQLTFTSFPYLGMATTHSANMNITCSSAAGTAISCGQKTKNTYLCVDTLGNRLESITYKLKDEGYKIGIMSSVAINHATPAAFYGHNRSRNAYYSISQEIPESGFEFFGGNGFLQYYGKDSNQQDITEYLKAHGYPVCFGYNEFKAAKDTAGRLIFCQPSSKGKEGHDYVTEDIKDSDSRLCEIMSMCLEHLGSDEPFFIMCEGGEIDWSAHANKTMTMIDDIMEFDAAVQEAYRFYLKHKDETLIVVTADHETGGISLGGPSGSSRRGASISWDIIEEGADAGKEENPEENKAMNNLANIGWTTNGHTGGPVPVYAIGKGAERFSGRMDNTDISKRILGE